MKNIELLRKRMVNLFGFEEACMDCIGDRHDPPGKMTVRAVINALDEVGIDKDAFAAEVRKIEFKEGFSINPNRENFGDCLIVRHFLKIAEAMLSE